MILKTAKRLFSCQNKQTQKLKKKISSVNWSRSTLLPRSSYRRAHTGHSDPNWVDLGTQKLNVGFKKLKSDHKSQYIKKKKRGKKKKKKKKKPTRRRCDCRGGAPVD